jgi:hypothetical protein
VVHHGTDLEVLLGLETHDTPIFLPLLEAIIIAKQNLPSGKKLTISSLRVGEEPMHEKVD